MSKFTEVYEQVRSVVWSAGGIERAIIGDRPSDAAEAARRLQKTICTAIDSLKANRHELMSLYDRPPKSFRGVSGASYHELGVNYARLLFAVVLGPVALTDRCGCLEKVRDGSKERLEKLWRRGIRRRGRGAKKDPLCGLWPLLDLTLGRALQHADPDCLSEPSVRGRTCWRLIRSAWGSWLRGHGIDVKWDASGTPVSDAEFQFKRRLRRLIGHIEDESVRAERTYQQDRAAEAVVQVALAAGGKPSKTRKGISADEANAKVVEYLRQHATTDHQVTARDLAGHIGCSTSTIHNCPAWQVYQNRLKAIQGPKTSPRTASLTKELEAVTGERDRELQRLIEEQAADYEPSPLEDDPPDGPPQRVREHKRL